ncbi:MAG: type II toxin-antitoxin system VapC family toxin [Acetobacteraceae bacterium]
MSFIGNNVLVYATAEGAPFRERARTALVRLAAIESLSISRQVLQEYVATTTPPQTWGKPPTLAEALADAAVFEQHFILREDGPTVWDRLVAFGGRFAFGGRQVHDANIVATTLAHGERQLLTFNDADFRRFADLIAARSVQPWRLQEPRPIARADR